MALTAAQAKFAHGIAVDRLSQVAAYSAAYDVSNMSKSTIDRRAREVAQHPGVKAEIELISAGATAAAITAAAYTLDKAISEAEDARILAHKMGQASAASGAVKLKAQLAGHVVERKEFSEKDPLKDATNDELVKLRAEIDARLSAGKAAAEVTEAPIVVPAAHIVHQIGAKEERRALN